MSPVIASEAKQSILSFRGTRDCFGSLAMMFAKREERMSKSALTGSRPDSRRLKPVSMNRLTSATMEFTFRHRRNKAAAP